MYLDIHFIWVTSTFTMVHAQRMLNPMVCHLTSYFHKIRESRFHLWLDRRPEIGPLALRRTVNSELIWRRGAKHYVGECDDLQCYFDLDSTLKETFELQLQHRDSPLPTRPIIYVHYIDQLFEWFKEKETIIPKDLTILRGLIWNESQIVPIRERNNSGDVSDLQATTMKQPRLPIGEAFKPLPACAADIIRFMVLVAFPGLYLDIGLQVPKGKKKWDTQQQPAAPLDKYLRIFQPVNMIPFAATIKPIGTESRYDRNYDSLFDLGIIYTTTNELCQRFLFAVLTEIAYRGGDERKNYTAETTYPYTAQVWFRVQCYVEYRDFFFEEYRLGAWQIKDSISLCSFNLSYFMAGLGLKNENKVLIDGYRDKLTDMAVFQKMRRAYNSHVDAIRLPQNYPPADLSVSKPLFTPSSLLQKPPRPTQLGRTDQKMYQLPWVLERIDMYAFALRSYIEDLVLKLYGQVELSKLRNMRRTLLGEANYQLQEEGYSMSLLGHIVPEEAPYFQKIDIAYISFVQHSELYSHEVIIECYKQYDKLNDVRLRGCQLMKCEDFLIRYDLINEFDKDFPLLKK